MKRISALLICGLLLTGIFTGCGKSGDSKATNTTRRQESNQETKKDDEEKTEASETLEVNLINATGYIFEEVYISFSSSSEMGSEKLGSTSILKSNGEVSIKLEGVLMDYYDVFVVDEDNDTYIFEQVLLSDKCDMEITFDGGIHLYITDVDGEIEVVEGVLSSSSGNDDVDTEGTGYETDGNIDFTVYNESEYDIYSIHMGPTTDSSEDVGFNNHASYFLRIIFLK